MYTVDDVQISFRTSSEITGRRNSQCGGIDRGSGMIEKVAIVGMGALGLLYSSYIAERTDREPVFILNEDRMARYSDRIFTVNGKVVDPAMQREDTAEPADLVLVAVKYNDLDSALDTMKNCVGSDTIIMSVLNGIVSEEVIAQRYGREKVVYTVAQGMDAVKIGDDLTYTQMGKLHIGMPSGADETNLRKVAEYFESVGIPYVKEKDIMLRMWSKFMLNVGINQACTAFETDYAGCLAPGEAHDTFIAAMREVVQVGQAEGIPLSEDTVGEYVDIIRTLKPDGVPSMRQDSMQKRPTEVEMFAGTVIQKAEKYGIPVPANEFLYCRIKEIEAAYLK